MTPGPDHPLLDAILDSWDRNHRITLNLLAALPPGGLEARASESSPTVAQQLTHLHHERLISVFEEAPEHARGVPAEEWAIETEPARLAAMLTESHQAVRDAVRGRVLEQRPLAINYDHAIQLVPFLLWHEGYHHGQIKLALKIAGHPIDDDVAGPLVWDVWRQRTR